MIRKKYSLWVIFNILILLLGFSTSTSLAQSLTISRPLYNGAHATITIPKSTLYNPLNSILKKDYIFSNDLLRNLRTTHIDMRLIIKELPKINIWEKLSTDDKVKTFVNTYENYYEKKHEEDRILITVQKGDTLYMIIDREIGIRKLGKKYRALVEEIVIINRLKDANTIKAGQTLIIPLPPIDIMKIYLPLKGIYAYS